MEPSANGAADDFPAPGQRTEHDAPASSGESPSDGDAGTRAEAGEEPDTGAEAEAPRVRRRRSERRITPRDAEKPSVVILSTPAVRRLEPSEEPRSRSQAPRS